MAKRDNRTQGTQTKSARPNRITYVAAAAEEQTFVPPVPFVPQEAAPAKQINYKKGFKAAGMALLIMFVGAGTAYGAASYYYSNRFISGTVINGIDCSGKTAIEAEELIAQQVEDYSIEVKSRNLAAQTIDGESIDYRYASDGEVLKLLKEQKSYEWVRGFFERRDYTVATRATYDKKLLEKEVKALDAAQEENQEEPKNAYVAFQNNQFEIIPETEGSTLLVKQAYKALDTAISSETTSIDLGSIPEVYETAELTSESPELVEAADAYNNLASASITYDFGDTKVTLDGSKIQSWLKFDADGQLVQDDASFHEKVREYVAEIASQYDTVGTERAFNTTSGRTVYVYGSAYGWQIDQAAETEQLIADIRAGANTTREPIYSSRANSHGFNDFGDTYIEVDLSSQYMYYYQNGSIIMDSPIVSGLMSDPARQTPSGVYTLYYKKSPEVLRGPQREDGTYEYETNVTYWMPFNGGIGFHDATWQPYFGGDRFMEGGSHGCINLPYDSAAYLYSIIDYNVPIICFY